MAVTLQRWTLLANQVFTTGTAAAVNWITGGMPGGQITLRDCTALYGVIRSNPTGTFSATGTLSAFLALVEVERGWGYGTISPGNTAFGVSFSAPSIVGTTAMNTKGLPFTLFPAPDSNAVFPEDSAFPIDNVKFYLTKPSGVAEAMQVDVTVYGLTRGHNDQMGTNVTYLGTTAAG